MDESDMRPEWANRPRIGNMVCDVRNPEMVGEVVDTFYRNGDGGMHVVFDHGGSWMSCRTAKIVVPGEKVKP